MVEPLGAADRSSLNTERGSVNMAMIGVILLEDGPGVTLPALRQRIAERIHLLPRYRQRLHEPSVKVANPTWVDDTHFDLDWHVRQARLPKPGGMEELQAYVAQQAGIRMDRSRPLWELHLVEGLPGGRKAVIPKMHHALLDGMAAVGIAMVLLDPGPDPLPVEPPEQPWQPRPTGLRDLLLERAQRRVGEARKLAIDSAIWLLDTSPLSAADDVRDAVELTTELARQRPGAPRGLALNAALTPQRSYAMVRADLGPLKAAGKAAGGTVNDVVLAAVAGMLRGYFAAAGVDVDAFRRDPVALVPVSVREDGDASNTGNHISIVFVDLPVAEADPGERVRLVNARMARIKDSQQIRAGAMKVQLGGFAPPLLTSVLNRMPSLPGADGPDFNLVVSNVPGPQLPLYLNGSKVLAVHPCVPLNPANQRLNVGVFSYDGQVCFGVTSDRALQPGAAVAAAALRDALTELSGG